MKNILSLSLAAALAMTAGAAVAQETSMTASYQRVHVDLPGPDATASGLKFDLDGKYDGGFSYEIDVFGGEVSGLGVESAAFEGRYAFYNGLGVAARYEYAEVAGFSNDATYVGMSGAYSFGAVEIDGSALVDIDHDDSYLFQIGGEYDVTNMLTLGVDLNHYNRSAADGGDTTGIDLNGRYALSGGAFIEAGVTHSDINVADVTGARLGLGFSF